MNTIYTAKRDEHNALVAHILHHNSVQASQIGPFHRIHEMQAAVTEHYGPEVEYIPVHKFEAELASRQVHTPEIIALLQEYSTASGVDITRYAVYGSPMRPMSAVGYNIRNAIYIPSEQAVTGYYTYIAVPWRVSSELVEQYELVFVSRPQIS